MVEVTQHDRIPADLETFILPGGLYAVFLDHGPGRSAPRLFQCIPTDWLPASAYVLNDRPHFEVLDDKYNTEDPTSEEEI